MSQVVIGDDYSIDPVPDFVVSSSPILQNIGEIGSLEEVTIRDQVFNRVLANSVVHHAQLNVSPVQRDLTYTSSDESKAIVSNSGRIQTITQGNVVIRVGNGRITKAHTHQGIIDGEGYVDNFSRFSDGTLGNAILSQTLALVANSTNKAVFTSANHVSAAYVRNPNCWVQADMSAWPVWSSGRGARFNGCAVSPRHIINADHVRLPRGSTLRFVTATNEVIERTVVDDRYQPFDINISLLDSPLPNSIKFCRVLPYYHFQRITESHIPLIAGNRNLDVVSRQVTRLFGDAWFHESYASGPLASVSESIVGGDSGSPVWVLLNGELLLCGTHMAADAIQMISWSLASINAKMSSLGGGYQLSEVDLSSYPSY